MHPSGGPQSCPGPGCAPQCRELLTSSGSSSSPSSLLCVREALPGQQAPRTPRSAGLRRPPAGPHSARRRSGQLTAGRRLARGNVRRPAGSGRGGADHRRPLPTAWTDRSCDQAHCLPTAADARPARRRLPPARLPGPHLIGARPLILACTDPAPGGTAARQRGWRRSLLPRCGGRLDVATGADASNGSPQSPTSGSPNCKTGPMHTGHLARCGVLHPGLRPGTAHALMAIIPAHDVEQDVPAPAYLEHLAGTGGVPDVTSGCDDAITNDGMHGGLQASDCPPMFLLPAPHGNALTPRRPRGPGRPALVA